MLNKCLLFVVIVVVAAKRGADNRYGDILSSLFLAVWLLELSWVDDFLFTPLVHIGKQLYYLNAPRSRM